MRIKSARYEYEIWLVVTQYMLDKLFINLNIMTVRQIIFPDILQCFNFSVIFNLIIKLIEFLIAIVSIPWYIHVLPSAFAFTFICEMSLTAWLKSTSILSMHAYHHNFVCVVSQILCTITMMNIPVENKHSFLIKIINQIVSCNNHIVYEAKSCNLPSPLSVMPRWSYIADCR